jgi:hypothetical protein
MPQSMHNGLHLLDRYGTKHNKYCIMTKDAKFCQYTEEEYELDGKIPFDEDLIRENGMKIKNVKISPTRSSTYFCQ